MLRIHALCNHALYAAGRRTATFVCASNPWAHLQDSFSDPMAKLHQIDELCEDQAPCEYIRDSRYSAAKDVTMNVLWPEPWPERVPRCETWKWSPFTTFSAARLTWSLGSCPSSNSTTVKRDFLRLLFAHGLLYSISDQEPAQMQASITMRRHSA